MKGMNIGNKYLNMNNLRIADDIVLLSECPKQLEEMLNELITVSKNIGLQLNTSKKKIILTTTIEIPVTVDGDVQYCTEIHLLGETNIFCKF